MSQFTTRLKQFLTVLNQAITKVSLYYLDLNKLKIVEKGRGVMDKYCQKCNKLNHKSNKHCGYCGNKLTTSGQFGKNIFAITLSVVILLFAVTAFAGKAYFNNKAKETEQSNIETKKNQDLMQKQLDLQAKQIEEKEKNATATNPTATTATPKTTTPTTLTCNKTKQQDQINVLIGEIAEYKTAISKNESIIRDREAYLLKPEEYAGSHNDERTGINDLNGMNTDNNANIMHRESDLEKVKACTLLSDSAIDRMRTGCVGCRVGTAPFRYP